MLKLIIRNALYLIISVVILTIIFTKVIINGRVSGISMNPTLANGDRIVALRRSQPKRGDIIMFRASDKKNTLYIKRVIGIPGDTIKVIDDILYVNNKPQTESYLADAKSTYEKQTGQQYTNNFDLYSETKRFNVPTNQYFVLGDNRPDSTDSRTFGFIGSDSIEGILWLRYFPFTKINLF